MIEFIAHQRAEMKTTSALFGNSIIVHSKNQEKSGEKQKKLSWLYVFKSEMIELITNLGSKAWAAINHLRENHILQSPPKCATIVPKARRPYGLASRSGARSRYEALQPKYCTQQNYSKPSQ